MRIVLWIILLATSYAQTQSGITPAPDQSAAQKPDVNVDDLFPSRELGRKVGLVRGVLNRIDPIYDQLVIQTFGGRSIRIAFDGRTQISPETSQAKLASLPAGSVVSIDTVTENGKLFAKSVRTSASGSAELNGQVIRYDATRSHLILRDPITPEEVTIRITPNTKVVKQDKSTLAQNLSSGTLVHVLFSAAGNTAQQVEIIAEPGNTFTFEGRIIAVDLHSRVLSLSNATDQSLRELAFGTLDSGSLSLLREGAEVSIQAEFDGQRYNVRSVTPMPQNP